MGYQPDPRLTSLMAQIRRSQKPRSREVLAWVWFCPKEEAATPFYSLVFDGARQRAERLGCVLEPFWIQDKDISPHKLHKALRTRGISGVLLSPANQYEPMTLDWDWSAFAVAIIGMKEWEPVLHRAGHDYYRSLWRCMQRLNELKAARPLFLLDQGMDERLHHMLSAGFRAMHPDQEHAPDLIRLLSPNVPLKELAMPSALAPDAVLTTGRLSAWEYEIIHHALPSVKHWITMNWSAESVAPGICTRYDLIAGAAVDLVLAQLHRNERGTPNPAKVVLLEGEWREATSPL